MPLSNRLAAKFFGTFWLMLGGCGSAVIAAAGVVCRLVSGERSLSVGIEGPANASQLTKSR